MEAIRKDLARPTVHARNLFHISAAMYDAWAVYDSNAQPYFLGNSIHGYDIPFDGVTLPPQVEVNAYQEEAISYACFRLLEWRFRLSPGQTHVRRLSRELMADLGYDVDFISTDYHTQRAASLGNYIALQVIEYGKSDGANETNFYENQFYESVNGALNPKVPGNADMTDPNRWQPLLFDEFIDQSGHVSQNVVPDFLSPEWGATLPFALDIEHRSIKSRQGHDYFVFHDPGSPAYMDIEDAENSLGFQWNHSLVALWSAHHDPTDGVLWDISPAAIGNLNANDFPTSFAEFRSFYDKKNGGDISSGRLENPVTGDPYLANVVPRGDYTRVLAEFWADGPDSETPPGHWFVILNYVNDHSQFVRQFAGEGDVLGKLEWDVKSYFLLGGAMHDAAIAAWGIKGYYDYVRPISAIRYMADLGQSTDMTKPNYHPNGIPLELGFIEVVDNEDPLRGEYSENVGKIKIFGWRGPEFIENPEIDQAGVGWILAENWWPYQRPTFITPPFAGYVSGHSTFSRAAAELITLLTGSEYFPGGMGEFQAKKNEFLVFEEGPSVDVTLQWATYRDASDQCSLSRIWGGIHPPIDDIPGRVIGQTIGIDAFVFGSKYFSNTPLLVQLATDNVVTYPNPVRSGKKLYLKGGGSGHIFSLLTLSGQNIRDIEAQYTSSSDTYVFDLPAVESGIYALKSHDLVQVIFVN
ncbi:MAG: vanadium-dependent haloperoxidase [Cyclobacteriaceae bacterium]